jgi:hypothetical protein
MKKKKGGNKEQGASKIALRRCEPRGRTQNTKFNVGPVQFNAIARVKTSEKDMV